MPYTYLKVSKERIHQQIQDNERCKYCVQYAHEDESTSQPKSRGQRMSSPIENPSTYFSTNSARFSLFNTFLMSRPCGVNKTLIRQNLKFDSRTLVNIFPFPSSSLTTPCPPPVSLSKGTLRSSNSLLKSAIR